MGLFNHSKPPQIEFDGRQYTVTAFVDKFNELAEQLDQTQQRLAAARQQAKQHRDAEQCLQDEKGQLEQQVAQLKQQLRTLSSVEVAGIQMSAQELAERYLKVKRALVAATAKLDRVSRGLAVQQDRNQQLQDQLDQAQQVTIDGQTLTIPELVRRYRQLVQQSSSIKAEQSTAAQPPTLATGSLSKEELIDRYYELVQSSLTEYQDEVARLKDELTKNLTDHHESELLQLTDLRTSPTSYQRLLSERSQQLLNYLKDHPRQEQAVRRGKHAANEGDQLRGLNYWDSFVYQYRQTATSLLKKNRTVRQNFQYALRYDKELAKRIAERMPFYLTDQNVVDLQTIQGGIGDEEAVKKDVNTFRFNIIVSQQGEDGERLVRRTLEADQNSRVLFSLNLPYRYGDGKENSNQIDGIVINERGIFVLEIKNYAAKKLWINRDGAAVAQKDGKQQVYQDCHDRGIVDQGRDHHAAVLQALETDDQVRRHIRYLKRQLHVLYVSTAPHVQLVTTGADIDPNHRFVSLDELPRVIAGAQGRLRPDIIQQVAAAISNQQQGEKQFKYKCFPADPDRRAELAWQQYVIMREMLQMNLDDLVAQRDPAILAELDQAGLRACNGFVTSKPHHHKR